MPKRVKPKRMKTKAKRVNPIGIVPRRSGRIKPKAAAGIVPTPPTTGFSAHTGEVMYFPRVRAVYWGSAYGSQTSGVGPLGQALDTFFASIIPSAYFGFLAEYAVNMPTYFGSTWLPHDSTSAITMTVDMVTATLTAWLQGGLLPEAPGPDEKDLLYIIFLSPEMSINVGVSACGFHSAARFNKGFGKNNLFYAVVGSSADLNALTNTASHELVEAFSDRSLNAWFSDNRTDVVWEIGDVCNSCGGPALTLNGFVLASYWRNSVGNCLQQNDITPPRAKMSVNTNLVHRSGLQRTIDVTVTDSASKVPLAGATVVIQEAGGPSGVTGVNGTVRITYVRCLEDVGSRIEAPCSGTVSMPGYKDAYFLTPIR